MYHVRRNSSLFTYVGIGHALGGLSLDVGHLGEADVISGKHKM